MIARLLGSAALVLVVACSVSSTSDEPAEATSEALGHCRTVCAKCHPNEICPLYCYEDCTAPPVRCTETQLCAIGATWDSKSCSCVPAR